jgi:ribonuclease HII
MGSAFFLIEGSSKGDAVGPQAGGEDRLLHWERHFYRLGVQRVAGVDEAGRGPLAGPVAAAAVILPRGSDWAGVFDSKQLREAERERLYEVLTGDPAVDWSIVLVQAEEIDRLNILGATHEAMRRALAGLRVQPDCVLVDGLPVRDLGFRQHALVGGDALSRSIAAASILAKVTRDRWMQDADLRFPGYGFARHKGYPTKAHLQALAHLGACPIHRRTFRPVAEVCGDRPDQGELGF